MKNLLRHLAIVVDGTNTVTGKTDASLALDLLQHFSRTVHVSFSQLPGLVALSLFSPELQEIAVSSLLSAQEAGLLKKAFDELRRTAGSVRAGLLILGDRDGLTEQLSGNQSSFIPSLKPVRHINVFLNYSGRREITDAAARCLEKHPDGEVDEETFSSHLLTAGQPDPDLIIYAGGTLEPKDFLLWQSSYAEIWHKPGNGLGFCEEDLYKAVENFDNRSRRFGKV